MIDQYLKDPNSLVDLRTTNTQRQIHPTDNKIINRLCPNLVGVKDVLYTISKKSPGILEC